MADTEHALQRHASTVEEQDEEELGHFGYKQELRRDWGLMHNFGISFSIIVSHSKSPLFPLANVYHSQSSLVSRPSSHMA